MGKGVRQASKKPAHHALYKTARWLRIRERQLRTNPLCLFCQQFGRITKATVCDHVIPHRGDVRKFYAGPFQSLCKRCHDSHKQSEEAGGVRRGCDIDGNPVSPGEHWR